MSTCGEERARVESKTTDLAVGAKDELLDELLEDLLEIRSLMASVDDGSLGADVEFALCSELDAEELGRVGRVDVQVARNVHHVGDDGLDSVTAALDFGRQHRHAVAVVHVAGVAADVDHRHDGQRGLRGGGGEEWKRTAGVGRVGSFSRQVAVRQAAAGIQSVARGCVRGNTDRGGGGRVEEERKRRRVETAWRKAGTARVKRRREDTRQTNVSALDARAIALLQWMRLGHAACWRKAFALQAGAGKRGEASKWSRSALLDLLCLAPASASRVSSSARCSSLLVSLLFLSSCMCRPYVASSNEVKEAAHRRARLNSLSH